MMKTLIITSAITLTGAAQPIAEQTKLPLPETKVVAQIAYMEISHGPTGFEFSMTEDTAIFVDLEISGTHHVRIGF